jgi:predicted lipoprotein with Yx(FWY)xxD motif
MNRFLTRAGLFAASAIALAGVAQAAGMLTAMNGMTLYVFDNDKAGKSTCYEACAVNWPPYLAKAGETKGEGWTMVKRKDGAEQWAYDGKPLYFFKGDAKAGDMKGDGIKKLWHIVKE